MASESVESISVIIPTFGNRIEFLIQAVNSAVVQSFSPIEVIIVNNGQNPLSKKGFNNPSGVPINVINTIYAAGASQARNIGATFAKGYHLAFLDDDDFWETNYLEEMHKKIQMCKSKCVVARIVKFQGNKLIEVIDPSGYLTKRYFLVMNPGVTGSNILIEKEFFLSLGGYDCMLPTGEDGDLALKVLDSGEAIEFCDTTQVVMRDHGGERLTDSVSLAKGYKAVYLKYKDRVGIRDTTYLIWRYKREEYRSRKGLLNLCGAIFWSFFVVLLRRTPRSIYINSKIEDRK